MNHQALWIQVSAKRVLAVCVEEGLGACTTHGFSVWVFSAGYFALMLISQLCSFCILSERVPAVAG